MQGGVEFQASFFLKLLSISEDAFPFSSPKGFPPGGGGGKAASCSNQCVPLSKNKDFSAQIETSLGMYVCVCLGPELSKAQAALLDSTAEIRSALMKFEDLLL